MFVDLIGIFLTVIIVSPRYWLIVLLLSFIESTFTVLISMALESSITEVIAGGIFTTITGSFNNNLITIFSPLFLLFIGLGLHRDEKIPWLDLINPIADFKRPAPALMIKTALCRILIISLLSNK
ncbi:MAG: hypothetical protein GX892_07825 [Thermoanaerobacteraceae bacterium]|nr:hypothetical protein [Thermoanaerobacteraceae bacterium]